MMAGCSKAFRAAASCCCAAARALLAAPWFANDYLLTVLIIILYFAYAGQAWNVMMGFAGQLSLGHALYVGLGAYAPRRSTCISASGRGSGLPIAGRGGRAGAIIGFLAFRFGVAGVYFAILTIAFAEFARIGFDHFRWVGGSSGFFLPVANYTQQRSVEPARQSDDVLLRDAGAHGRALRALPRCCCGAASAITGRRSARTRRPRARSASTPSATRWPRWSSPPA